MSLIVDVTQLIHWPGELTGIPRVMNELTVRYAKDPAVVFVAWDPHLRVYKQVNVTQTLKERGQHIYYVSSDNSMVASPTKKPFLFRAVRKLKASGVPVPSRVLQKLDNAPEDTKTITIGTGDTLFVLWGEQGSTDFIQYLKKVKNEHGATLVQICYDMLPLVVPQYSGHSTDSMRTYTTEIFPQCDLVLAISESTRRDLQGWMEGEGLDVPTIQFFRLGDDFALSKPQKPKEDAFINSGLTGNDYILCVGTIEARKNHTLLYYAYKDALNRGIALPKIVLSGRRGWRSDDVYDMITQDPQTKDYFVPLHNVSDDNLAWLYAHCLFSVYPSFYEGWGLPVAESIAYGVPCITTNVSSIPEVAGDLLDYFSPTSTDECVARIEEYLDPKKFKAAKKKLKKYTVTTWEDTYNEVQSYIKNLSRT